MRNKKLSTFSKIVLILSGLLLIGAIFFPIWRIELTAPQYPEGLVLKLHPSKIAGDVDIINGLNHYIGMKTLHTEDFIEFKVLPFILGGLGIISLVCAWSSKRKSLFIFFFSFMLFGILSACDFYRWNYEYGHNLDPNAAIRVPGMAYQPPMLGYKQLLNFGAYSMPDIGGWMLIAVGVLLFAATVKEKYRTPKSSRFLSLFLISAFLYSCSNDKPVPIKLNVDNCDFCMMGISDGRHGAEIITQKGRAYKFDDIACMAHYCKQNTDIKIKAYYVHDYTKNNELISAENAFFVSGGTIKSPMNGNIAAFLSKSEAKAFEAQSKGLETEWNDILKK
ncbi:MULTISPECIES: nitrous oxide reductase accessory protein NosL [Flavobacterium]|uniref:nitrous oxide reductase accessory protein NosL n=1 Tax=Flavobacterium TaxID=237 RepID=UPI0011832D15|nr:MULTISPECIES: nitrous oxide reductase accessory protein NosL [Flavobacterium]MCR4033730.1 nitrous oxide reductase accessory protein NosL [Flavobacterium panacis]